MMGCLHGCVILMWFMAFVKPNTAETPMLRVVSIPAEPYLHDDGNETYSGYIVDLLHQLTAEAGFDYSIQLSPDGKYGNPNPDGSWNGMIGALIRDEADVIAAPLSVTYMRNKVVDFTRAFMTSDIKILLKKPVGKQPDSWASKVSVVFTPFTPTLWVMIFLALLVMAFILVLIGQSRSHGQPTDQSKGESGQCGDRFNIGDYLRTVTSCLTFKGQRGASTSIAGSTLISFWWIFLLCIVTSYTSALTAYLTLFYSVPRVDMPIQSFDDLAKQTYVRYGAVDGGSTFNDMRHSKLFLKQRLYSYMAIDPSAMPKSISEGVRRVRQSNGDYAFLMEGPSADYAVGHQPCNLMAVGDGDASNEFALACQKGSPICSQLDSALLKIKESENLRGLKWEWWVVRNECGSREDHKNAEERHLLYAGGQMTFEMFSGAFLVLLIGVILSILVFLGEWLCVKKGYIKKEPANVDEVQPMA